MDNPPLPSEILYQIFEYFCLHCQEKHSVSHEQILHNKTDKSRRALLSLSRTCKNWGCIAQNVLHHYFKHSDDRRQILFCRTICENPELGERLQVASLHRSAGIDHHLFAQLWFKESMARYIHLLGQGPLKLHSCTVSWGDYIAPIILLRAPNLKHLVVHGPYNPSIFEEFSMEAVLRNRALPQKLESLSVGQQEISCLWHLEPRVRTDLDALGGFLMRLENLETLSISRPNLERLPEKLPLQKLRRLRIGNACLSKDTLQRLINSTGSLEEFVYREIEDAAESTVTRLVTSQEIFEMLIPMRVRLKRVVLRMYSSERPPTALAQLVNLQQLRINAGDKFSDILNLPPTPFNFEHRSMVSVYYTNHLASSTKYRRSSNGYSKSRLSDAAIQETIQQSSENFSS
ncbi:hypothetical protein FOYG_02533 [Fusarium oxysporum NRRL 32931]|uniref:F-box domain-containing protein n=1 Tax=Fusarium oxysporum NRRL 32931 TaxID=660029 RepID=W9IS29_FUSOX|nr:hypothetical protein FOYG_02533 [Fusarium oxysporum NRRL 32931]